MAQDNDWWTQGATAVDSAKPESDWWKQGATAKEPPSRTVGAALNDTVIEVANAAAGGVSSAANFVKPGNAVSEWIDKNIIEAGEAKQSDVVKAEKQRLNSDLAAAEGVGDEVAAVGRYIVNNPVLSAAQAAGSFVGPGLAVKGATTAARAVGAGAKAVERAGRAGGVAAGAAMAGGDAAGTAHELATQAGATEDQAVAAGRQASVIPAIVGGIGGAFGAEKLLAGAKGFSGGVAARALKTGASEAAQEGIEEGVTQYEGQRAAVPYDPNIDPSKGVAGAAAMGAALGGITGAGMGAFDGIQEARRQQASDPLSQAVAAQQAAVQDVGSSVAHGEGTTAAAPEQQDADREQFQASLGVRQAPVLDEARLREQGATPAPQLNTEALDRALGVASPKPAEDSTEAAPAADESAAEPVPKPSEAMGLDANAGDLSAAAVQAVDSGAHDQMQQAAALAQAAEQVGKAKPSQKQKQESQTAPEVDPQTVEVTPDPGMAAWSDADLSTAFRGAQSREVRLGLAKELQRRRAAREQQALQAELAAEQDGTAPGAERADTTFASVTEDAGAPPASTATTTGAPADGPTSTQAQQAGAQQPQAGDPPPVGRAAAGKAQPVPAAAPAGGGGVQALGLTAPAAQPEFTTVKTVRGNSVTVRTADLAGDAPRLRQFTKDGKPKVAPAIHRDNLDATGEQGAAIAAENAGNPLFNTVTRKGGTPFGSRSAAQREVNRLGLSGTHDVVPTGNGFVGLLKLEAVQTQQGAPSAPSVENNTKKFAPETGTLGIPRADMPQVPTPAHGGLVRHLNSQGIAHETTTVDAAALKPTQAEYSPAKVEAAKTAGGDRGVIVSSDGHIIDGHHQAMAAAEDGKPVKAIVLDAPVEQALEAVKNSPSAARQQVQRPAAATAQESLRSSAPTLTTTAQSAIRGEAKNRPSKPRMGETADEVWTAIKQAAGGVVSREGGSRLLYPTLRVVAGDSFRVDANGDLQVVDRKLRGVGVRDATRAEADEFYRDLDGDRVEVVLMTAPGYGSDYGQQQVVEVLHSPSGLSFQSASRSAGVTDGAKVDTQATAVPAPEQRTSVAAAPARIEDFGEELRGARKMLYAEAYADGMAQARELDVQAHPLSKTWPEPDYGRLLDGGATPQAVALVRALRDAVPTKPQTAWKLKAWAQKLQALRGFADDILAGRSDAPAVLRELERAGIRDVSNQAALYEAVGHERSLKGVSLSSARYSMYEGVAYDPPRTLWTVERQAKASPFGHWPRELASGDTREAAIAAFQQRAEQLLAEESAPTRGASFEIYGQRAGGARAFFIGKKIGKNVAELKGGFADIKAARQYLAGHQAELEQLLAQYKAVPPVRRAENAQRIGQDHRQGADVTPAQFQETFGFRGVQFGNYVEGKRRQQDLNQAYDALMDLAGVLELPPRALSLGGRLGLAFGARGAGGVDAAAAHYERGEVVINLTKRQGAGSLAHEWWHGLDNYFSRQRGDDGSFMSEDASRGDGVREEMRAAFRDVISAIHRTGMQERSRKLDGRRTKEYWSTKPEMSARAFESYVIAKLQDQGAGNDYLANVVSDAVFALEGAYPYPTAGELPEIRAAFDGFFQTVQTREEGGTTVLFRRDTAEPFDYEAMQRVVLGKPAGFSAAAREQAVSSVRQTVDAIRAAWGPNAPEVVVAFDMQDAAVPESARQADLRQRSGGARGAPEGFYYRGKAYLMASQLNTPADATRVLFHEVLGHHGLRGKFGKDLDAVLNQLATMRKAEVDAKIKDYGLRGVSNLDRRTAAEEVLAEMAEKNPQLHFVRRAVAAIRNWLRTHVPGFKNLRLTDDDIIQAYILPARGWVERRMDNTARLPAQGVVAPAYSRSESTQAGYEARIDALFGGGKAQVGTRVLDRSDVMGLLGYPDVPLMLNESHLRDGLTNHPEMTAAAWKKVPEWIENPAMVYRSLDAKHPGRIVMVAPELLAGYPVVMAIEPSPGVVGGKPGQASTEQLLVTVFAKTTGVVPAAVAARQGRLLYLNKQNAQLIGRGGGVQFPKHDDVSTGRTKILTEKHLAGWRRANAQQEQGGGDGAMFSRSRMAELKTSALDQIHQTLSHPGKVSLWDKSVGTMRNLAERAPAFKPVFETAQRQIDDVSMLANDAADMAPRLLPRVDSLGDILGKNRKKAISAEDNKAVARPLFEGTLLWGRDLDGKPVLVDDLQQKYANLSADEKAQLMLRSGRLDEGVLTMWRGLPVAQYEAAVNSRFEAKVLKAGVVWEAGELRGMFGLTDQQVSLYQEARAAIDRSIDMTARADMMRALGDNYAPMRDAALDAENLTDALTLLVETLEQEAQADPEARERLADHMHGLRQRYDKARELMAQGYAPLSRFGRYTLDVVDANGERQYFGMYESMADSNRARIQMASAFPGATISQGTMSAEAFKLFQGVTPESLQLFGNMLGLDAEGGAAQDKAFQQYLQLAKNNHSALKRLIHRKGIAGYSEDVGRVLASFVYSNARQAAGGLNAGMLDTAINAIPKEQGELKDVAMGLRSYIQDPQEEGQAVRGMLFAQYLGGSLASAFVNMTQPFQITMPWLSQYGGMAQAGKQMARALKDMGTKGFTYESDLAKALKDAEDDGTVSPQEIHQLMAQARGTGSLRVGDGTKIGDARAAASNTWERAKVAWGQPFALAEQFNRRSTFIASYRIAKAQGMTDPAEFARKAVLETQFLYSKANKMRWARGTVGGTLMTFKTYSVSYLELMHRMWTQGGPEGKRAVGWALAMLLLMGGAGGLPFMEDAEDLIDGMAQLMGYNVSAKQWRKQALRDIVGKELADFVEQGISGLPGAPVDVSGRLGMGNLIPGTGLLMTKQSRERDLLEIAGPAGDLVARGFSGGRKLLTGDVAGAALEVSPTAVRNAAKGIDMATSGIYKDTKGYKVIDTTLDEALAKAIGFQPKPVAEVQEANSFMQRSKSFYVQTSSEIKAQWAQALFEKDDAALQRARARLDAWNRDNPDQRIVVKMPDVWKRVREMGKDRTQRIAETAPKVLRQQMRDMARAAG